MSHELSHYIISTEYYLSVVDRQYKNGTISKAERDSAIIFASNYPLASKAAYAKSDTIRYGGNISAANKPSKINKPESKTQVAYDRKTEKRSSSSRYWKMSSKQFESECSSKIHCFKVDVGRYKHFKDDYAVKDPVFENGKLVGFTMYLYGNFAVSKKTNYNAMSISTYISLVEDWGLKNISIQIMYMVIA